MYLEIFLSLSYGLIKKSKQELLKREINMFKKLSMTKRTS